MRFLASRPSALAALVASFLAGTSAQTPTGFPDGTDVYLHMTYGDTQITRTGGQYQVPGNLSIHVSVCATRS